MYTTLNVQHLESLNDVVAQITGVVVRETVPDSVLERADEVELVDLPPDELLERLREGKVYVPEQAPRAIENFFRKGNLIALRELALRRTAERVDAQMRGYRGSTAIAGDLGRPASGSWSASGPSPSSARLVRAARRMATGLQCRLGRVVRRGRRASGSGEATASGCPATCGSPSSSGAETVTLSAAERGRRGPGTTPASTTSRKIVVGKPTHPRWRDLLRGSLVDELVRGSGDIDVYVISGDARTSGRDSRRSRRGRAPAASTRGPRLAPRRSCAARAGFAGAAGPVSQPTSSMMLPARGGRRCVRATAAGPPSSPSSCQRRAVRLLLRAAALDLRGRATLKYLLTFVVMLASRLIISTLTARVRQQAATARERGGRTRALYALSRELGGDARSARRSWPAPRAHVATRLRGRSAVSRCPDRGGRLAVPGASASPPYRLDDRD